MARRQERGERGALRLDPRLIIGIVLIAGSTIGVWTLVSGLDDGVEVYVARDTLTPGTTIQADDLGTESVRLGAAGAHYLAVGDVPADGFVITRTVHAGELVPDAAVDEADRTGLATIVVPSRGPLPAGIAAGAQVDVWTAKQVERGGFEPPSVLVSGAEIAGIIESEGMVSTDGVSVELLIPREKVAALLEALAAADAIDLVPARSAGE
ncbi:SAF domain-containing protein [Agromyces subbeticus]|uniref:SAF domain-containing protein n=1 Tax=Agromyces subbeticus TaxID=293890 RepID=UPI0003B6C9D1|nr:SAF domain-containing protein [Agromyces subbeticus]